MCNRPILIVEGPGDASAVPILVRRIAQANSAFSLQTAPRPKTNMDVGKLLRPGEIERFVEYTWRQPDGDSVLIALDCEDMPVSRVYSELHTRIMATSRRKPTAVVLFQREFEVIFLHSLEEVVSHYPEFQWRQIAFPTNTEAIRGVKQVISRMMPKDKSYKETRDQPRFSSVIDLVKARSNSSFRQLERAVLWIASQHVDSRDVLSEKPI